MARTVKCPGCGADLTVKDGNRDFMFCEYCGTKVRLDDYQETHRYVNEAEVKKVEADREIELRKMELEERANQTSRQNRLEDEKRGLLIGLVGFALFFLLCKLGELGIL